MNFDGEMSKIFFGTIFGFKMAHLLLNLSCDFTKLKEVQKFLRLFRTLKGFEIYHCQCLYSKYSKVWDKETKKKEKYVVCRVLHQFVSNAMERFTKMLVLCTEFMRIHKRGLVNSLHLAIVLKNLRKSRPRTRTFQYIFQLGLLGALLLTLAY